MADTVPLAVTVTGIYMLWFGTHYWRDTKTHWPSDPVKAVLTGKPIPAVTRGLAPDKQITVATPGPGGSSSTPAPSSPSAPSSSPGSSGPPPIQLPQVSPFPPLDPAVAPPPLTRPGPQ